MVGISNAASAVAHMSSSWVTRRVRMPQPAVLWNQSSHAQTDAKPQQWVLPLQKSKLFGQSPASSHATNVSLRESLTTRVKEKFSSDTSLMEKTLEEINRDMFWSKYSTMEELSRVDSKQDILKIINTFLFISKKSVFLFSTYSRKIIANRYKYSANELGQISNAFAQLGFLEPAFCMQISDRVLQDIQNVSPTQLVNLMDAYATTRCYLEPVVDKLSERARNMVGEFSLSEISLFASSLARLNVKNDGLFDQLGNAFVNTTDGSTDTAARTARDVTLCAYAFSKMKAPVSEQLLSTILSESENLIRDFTAKELQMITTALDKWDVLVAESPDLFAGISAQAQRRMAQFSPETLVALLKSLAARNYADESLITRVVCQLPRFAAQSLKSTETVGFIQVLTDMQAESELLWTALRPVVVMQAGQFTVTEWLSVLKSVVEAKSAAQEVIDAFVLLNESPAKYKATGATVVTTVIQRMTKSQLNSLILEVSSKMHESIDTTNLDKLVADRIETDQLDSNVASDLYCSFVAKNYHEKDEFSLFMKSLLNRAISTPQ